MTNDERDAIENLAKCLEGAAATIDTLARNNIALFDALKGSLPEEVFSEGTNVSADAGLQAAEYRNIAANARAIFRGR